jgi:uncharacterized protein YlxW (UPF0749 family)
MVNIDPLDVANWTVRYNDFTYTVNAGGSAGAGVTLTLTQAGANPGADTVSYAPPPDDLVTLMNELPVLPFADFPVTV